jgi:hypothetical protein
VDASVRAVGMDRPRALRAACGVVLAFWFCSTRTGKVSATTANGVVIFVVQPPVTVTVRDVVGGD